jgi:outer membrane receptor protein involved in Fe transport
VRSSVLCVWGFSAGLSFYSPCHAAAEVAPQPDADGEVLEEVTVVGTRLRRSNLDSPSPVIIFDASQLHDEGIATLGEFTRYLPQNAGLFSPGSLGGSAARGTASFNLRGLGPDATLTLVNGRRVAPYGSSGDLEPFVDINAIPVAAIERIEILTDGASAIYGSDAVAGVVNIVTRESIDGVVAEGGYLTTSHGDGDEWDLSLAGGWHSADTVITGTLSWFDGGVIWNRDRAWASNLDLSDRGGYDYSSPASSPPTVFLLDSGIWLADPACPEYSATAHRVVYEPGVDEGCVFNYWQYTTLQNPSERLGITASLRHEFSDATEFFAELLASRTETDATVAPVVLLDNFVAADHPNNPFGEDLILEGRALDTGPRGFHTQATNWRLVAGLTGYWGEWEWEAAVIGAESEADQSRSNFILSEPFQLALLGFGGPNGDQYYNPFGLSPQNPQEVIDQFLISGTRFSETGREQTADFQVSGKFGDLPGGPIGAAFGGQFRHQSVDQSADEEELTGVIAGTEGFEPISADTDIWSAFVEFVVPFLPTLEAQLAARLDDYSAFGSTTNPKVGLGWRPADGLLLRATWGTSFRPPTFRELSDPPVSYEDAIFYDPWRCPVTGAPVDCRFNLITGHFSGNPNLEPDEGETWLFGVAWEPDAVLGLALAVDYWSIEHRNRIVASYDDLFLDGLPPDQNPFIVRAPQTPEDLALGIPGVIVGRRDTYINADRVTSDGIDFNLAYEWQTSSAGDFSSALTYTYLNRYETGISYGAVRFAEDIAGGWGFPSAWPQHRGNVQLGWTRASHGIAAQVIYAGSYQSGVTMVIDGRETDMPFIVDDYWQLDIQYSHEFQGLRSATLRLGCRNCLDANPPVYNYPIPGEYLHEGRGALLYLRWTQPFG